MKSAIKKVNEAIDSGFELNDDKTDIDTENEEHPPFTVNIIQQANLMICLYLMYPLFNINFSLLVLLSAVIIMYPDLPRLSFNLF